MAVLSLPLLYQLGVGSAGSLVVKRSGKPGGGRRLLDGRGKPIGPVDIRGTAGYPEACKDADDQTLELAERVDF